MDTQIYLRQGYDSSVSFELEGTHANWFVLQSNENVVTISPDGALPTEVLANNRFLVFTVKARQGSLEAEATVIIEILDDFSSAEIMRFERISYQGSIEDDTVLLEQIVLSEGYRADVVFSLHGDLSSYFEVHATERVVTLTKSRTIPDELLDGINVIVLELHATAPETITGYTTIVLSLSHTTAVTVPAFSQAYYTGRYETTEGLTMDTQIYLRQGYDSSVSFELEGTHANWFVLQSNENVVTISPDGALPTEVLANNRFLVFTVKARQGSLEAEATVIIEILDDFSSAEIMRFERISYQGSIEDDTVLLEQIVLSEGYRADVVFSLHGDLSSYFEVHATERVVTLTKSRTIPDELLDGINVIVLELHATAPETITGYTTIVLSLSHTTAVTVPAFSQAYYTGRYETTEGLTMDTQIYLRQGYDSSVSFELEGTHANWFVLQSNENVVTISPDGALPTEVLANNRFLVFTVKARQGSLEAEATVIIEILDDFSSAEIMRFERISYQGSIEDDTVLLEQIVLSEGYRADVVFLCMEISSYFEVHATERVVTLTKSRTIPDELLDGINVIVLELHATAPETITGYTTIVLSLSHTTAVTVPAFSQAYYTGRYETTEGLTMDTQIYLRQGYDSSVSFELEGTHANWFVLQSNENVVTISPDGALPTEVLANNRFLVFTVKARQGSLEAEATVIIEILDDFSSAEIMRFERISYQGSIEDDTVLLEQIVLSEGYRADISHRISKCMLQRVVTLTKSRTIPDELLDGINVIVLELHATAPETITGYTTIVLSLSHTTAVTVPAFSQAYYTGRYETTEGLTMDTQIYLRQGYDSSVSFELEGTHANWFVLQSNENVVTISPDGALPTEVLANNRFLVFTVKARQGSLEAEATVIIEILDDFSSAEIMRFERISYQGSIEDDTVLLEQIVLSEGYRADVVFSLHGDLSSYFEVHATERVVTLTKSRTIPDELLDGINVIVLELHATAPETITGYTTIVLSLSHTTAVTVPAFSQAYYTGRYETTEGLTMDTQIYLRQGYDSSVSFELEGTHANWFVLQSNENVVTISPDGALPTEVLANNRFLVFTVKARQGSLEAEATVIIEILDDLSSYFEVHATERVVTLTKSRTIPDELLDGINVIVLELHATAPETITGYDDRSQLESYDRRNSACVQPSLLYWALRNYRGINDGYANILTTRLRQFCVFELEGTHANWFVLQSNENVVTISPDGALPTEVLANNRFLVFTVKARQDRWKLKRRL
ncbi:hypothetical protein EVAR_7611_1 [Eumeta japonica]|uniref:Uncharacterized protein n=1 Tax=Eumeta variegata TaxID=151549 RepID=A0A4C1TL54_EUMVA|nr:hypothetical protein EVAR_7611_1 [Eumeta japonica]